MRLRPAQDKQSQASLGYKVKVSKTIKMPIMIDLLITANCLMQDINSGPSMLGVRRRGDDTWNNGISCTICL